MWIRLSSLNHHTQPLLLSCVMKLFPCWCLLICFLIFLIMKLQSFLMGSHHSAVTNTTWSLRSLQVCVIYFLVCIFLVRSGVITWMVWLYHFPLTCRPQREPTSPLQYYSVTHIFQSESNIHFYLLTNFYPMSAVMIEFGIEIHKD